MCGRNRVESVLDAQMSLAFSLALAIATGHVVLADYERLPAGPVTRRLTELVQVEVDNSLHNEAAIVTVTLTSGTILIERVDLAKGDPSNPMTDQELIAKFEELALRSLRPRSVRQSLKLLLELEKAETLSMLCRELQNVRTE